MRKKGSIAVALLLVIGVGFLVFLQPLPLLKQATEAEILYLELFSGEGNYFHSVTMSKNLDASLGDSEHLLLSEAMEQQILDLLSQSKTRRSFFQTVDGIAMEDMTIRLFIRPQKDKETVQTIYLGEESFSQSNRYRSNILQAEDLGTQVLAILQPV